MNQIPDNLNEGEGMPPKLPVAKEVIVSMRDPFQIISLLQLNIKTLPQTAKILDVGSGESDFPDYLAEKFTNGVIYSADPVFNILKQRDIPDFIGSEKVGFDKFISDEDPERRDYYRKSMRVEEFWFHSDRVIRISRSASNLRLPSDLKFDLITANALTIHYPLQNFIPELVRHLDEHGEIRLGSTHCQLSLDKNNIEPPLFWSLQLKQDKHSDDFYNDQKDNIHGGIQWLLEQGYRVYVVPDSYPKESMVSDKNRIRNAGLIIIRKDDILPELANAITKGRYKDVDGTLNHIFRLIKPISNEDIMGYENPGFRRPVIVDIDAYTIKKGKDIGRPVKGFFTEKII